MRIELDERRRIVGVDTVASSSGYTITRRRNLDLEAQVIAARHIYHANLAEAEAEAGAHRVG